MRQKVFVAVALTLLLSIMLVLTSEIRVVKGVLPVHNVNTGKDYATIQEAIDADETLEGHTIKADAGTYHENVVIWKAGLQIIGQNPTTTIIDASGMGEVIYSTVDDIRVSEFTIKNGNIGVYLSLTDNDTLVGNVITSNFAQGIYLDTSPNNIFFQNTISQNLVGIYLFYSSSNKIYNNNFVTNDAHIGSDASTNAWDDGYPTGGNYWSNYTGSDLNGDGIGDTAHIIDANNKDNYPLMNQWIAPDIAATDVSNWKVVVGQGLTMRINVTTLNQGNKIERFSLALYANAYAIRTDTITLLGGNSVISIYRWNTTGFAKGDYEIKAYVTPLSGETDQADNTRIGGTVKVKMPGNVNGDDRVYIDDLAIVASSFGAKYGETRYNSSADVNDDNKVDIDDIIIVARNYGEADP